MCNTKRNFSLFQKFSEYICHVLMFQNKIDFILYIFCASADICLYRPFKCFKSCFCIMEAFDCLMQAVCRIICQKSLEVSECICTLVKVFRFFYLIVAGSIRDKFVGTPVFSFIVNKVRLTVYGRNNIKCLSVRISAVFNDLLSQMRYSISLLGLL